MVVAAAESLLQAGSAAALVVAAVAGALAVQKPGEQELLGKVTVAERQLRLLPIMERVAVAALVRRAATQ